MRWRAEFVAARAFLGPVAGGFYSDDVGLRLRWSAGGYFGFASSLGVAAAWDDAELLVVRIRGFGVCVAIWGRN